MAEAEDVITDAARHATVFVQELWRRHRPAADGTIDVASLLQRLDLLLAGSFDLPFKLRLSQPPAPVPWVRRVFKPEELPAPREAIPATDGHSIWLPVHSPIHSKASIGMLQVLALQQAARAVRGAPGFLTALDDPLVRAIFEVLEADAADADVARSFPGVAARIAAIRRECLNARPALEAFPPARRPLEMWVRSVLEASTFQAARPTSCAASLDGAERIAARILRSSASTSTSTATRAGRLLRDRWLGELRVPPAVGEIAQDGVQDGVQPGDDAQTTVRSARMTRRPDVRAPDERDEQASQGAWMVQTAQPHEHAEDPFGMQRPTDRDEQQAAEEFADSLSELAEARLVSVPGAPKEILLSDDPPPTKARSAAGVTTGAERVLRYPEWDWRTRAYREPGAAVHELAAPLGGCEWVERTLEEHRALLQAVRRQFESLRAQRTRLRQQLDGEELDLEACVDAFADLRAGTAVERGLYRCTRMTQRELAVLLLIDVSGSTDGWVSQHRRVIDVEREALLLVCYALQSLGEPYSVIGFSGEGPHGVIVRPVKSFAETFGAEIRLRIAGLEPEKYTRAGAAIRHASSLLMREPARHRLLLLLSDGKPNDMDEYDGRYGVEDMRQSIVEARLQGIHSFCLTIDRHTASYLPGVFGEHQYAVLHRPELLPTALLGWLKRLVQQ
jgi:nitric oxide reductase NorD protein